MRKIRTREEFEQVLKDQPAETVIGPFISVAELFEMLRNVEAAASDERKEP